MNDSGKAAVETYVTEGVAHMLLRNPRRKNAITLDMAAEIAGFCESITDDAAVGVAVVRGDKDYFCSGADTRDLAASSSNPASNEAVERTSAVYGAFVRFGSLPVPTVAVVEGGAVGAGLNLALAADVMLVTPGTVIESGFLARSIHPGGGHLSLLGRAAGWSQTVATALLGVPLRGEQIVEAGLAHACVETHDIDAALTDLTSIASADPELTRRTMTSARLELGPPSLPWSAGVEIERGIQMWSMARKGEATWSSRGPK